MGRLLRHDNCTNIHAEFYRDHWKIMDHKQGTVISLCGLFWDFLRVNLQFFFNWVNGGREPARSPQQKFWRRKHHFTPPHLCLKVRWVYKRKSSCRPFWSPKSPSGECFDCNKFVNKFFMSRNFNCGCSIEEISVQNLFHISHNLWIEQDLSQLGCFWIFQIFCAS